MPGSAAEEPRISLLYVDDEPALLEITRLFLERNGNYSVSTCDNPHDALRIILQSSFDAIISDYQMPECDGISFLRHLRKIGNKTPFIIFTGKGREDIVIQALNEGADFYLQKGGDPKSQFAELSNKVLYAVTRKRGEEALRESEERYKNVVETQAEIISRFLPDGTHIFVNDAYCRRFNKTADDLIGERFKPVIHPDDAGEVARFFASLTPKHPVGMLEERIILPDGSIIWYRFNTRAFFNEDGTVYEYQSVGQDITELKDRERQLQLKNEELAAAEGEMRAAYEQLAASEEEIRSQLDENIAIQRQLALSEEQYRAIFEHTEAPTVILEEDTSISLANSAFAEISGYSQEELVGRSWTEFVSRPDLDRMLAHHRARREEGADPPTKYEFTFLNRHGEAREISLTVGMIPGTRQSVASFHDLTDVRMGERAVRESEERYRRIVDTSAEGIWQLDPLFRITYVNRQMAEMLGYSPGEMIGMDATSFIPPDEMADSEMRKAGVRRGEVDHFERRYIRKDGSSLWAQVAITPILDAEGGYQGSFSMITNVSERKAAEETLLQKNEELTAAEEELRQQVEELAAARRTILEREEQLRTVSNNIPGGIVYQHIIDSQGNRRFTYLSAGVERMFGITPAEAIGNAQLIYDTFLEDDRRALIEAEEQACITMNQFSCLARFQNPDGEIRWAQIQSSLKKMQDGSIVSDGICIDITERIVAQEVLRESEERYRSLFDQSMEGVYLHDPEGRILDVNRMACMQSGYSREEWLERTIFDGHPERSRLNAPKDEIIRAWSQWKPGQRFFFESEHQRKDGTIYPVEVSTGIVRYGNGDALLAIVKDITERKAAEQSLRESENRYRVLFEGSPQGILVANSETKRFLYANPAICSMLGYSEDELAGLGVPDIHPEESLESVVSEFESLVRGEKTLAPGVPCLRKDKTVFFADIHTAAIVIEGKNLSVAFFEDITERKAAEAVLKESEQRYREIFNSVNSAIWIHDISTFRFVHANTAMEEMFGYTLEEARELTVADISSNEPPFTEEMGMAFLKKAASGEPQIFDWHCRHKDGHLFWSEINLRRGTIAGKEYILAIHRDITERKLADAELAESEARYHNLIETSHDIIYSLSHVGDFLFVSPAWTHLLGHPVADVSGHSYTEFVHPDDLPACQAFLQKVFETGERQEGVEYRVKHSNGEWRWHTSSATPIRDAGGVVTRYTGIAHDITDRKIAEEALRASEEKYRHLIELAQEGIWAIDANGNTTFVNQRMAEVLEYSVEEMLGRHLFYFLDESEERFAAEKMERRRQGIIESHESELITKSGSRITILLSTSPITDENGDYIGALAVVTDITDRKRAEEALHTANRKLQLLSSITRHDILNQVMVLQGYLELSLPEIEDSKLSGYLSKVVTAATTIQKQIEFTKDYESLGVKSPAWQPLSAVIGTIHDERLPIHYECADFSVYADPMLEKVLQNLYDNTIRHAEGADCARIRCKEEDSDLIITWEDNGPGIPDDQKERIFDKGVGKNTGLGLFLTREILSITGIAISETGVFGKGARFEIRVPAGGFSVR